MGYLSTIDMHSVCFFLTHKLFISCTVWLLSKVEQVNLLYIALLAYTYTDTDTDIINKIEISLFTMLKTQNTLIHIHIHTQTVIIYSNVFFRFFFVSCYVCDFWENTWTYEHISSSFHFLNVMSRFELYVNVSIKFALDCRYYFLIQKFRVWTLMLNRVGSLEFER